MRTFPPPTAHCAPLATHRPLPTACCVLLFLSAVPPAWSQQSEPPALNPFGSGSERADQRRDDAVPGYIQTSDGKVHPGQITLTRDAKLKIYDEKQKKHREVPLKAIKRIDCSVLKEWMENEWRFKENANDEKYYTGRSYPAREYTHTITLQNGRKIEGTLSGIVYVRAQNSEEPTRYLLHKRDKGEVGTDLKSLVYVRTIQLGPKALEEGNRKAASAAEKTNSKRPTTPVRKSRS
ncbi:MAG: hypothetical protein ACP5XB_16305 [Isosphaeraceae bacterium]